MPYNQKGECRNTGRTHFKIGHNSWSKGRIFTKEHRRNIGLAGKGRISPRKGIKLSQETINKIKEAVKKQVNRKGPKGKPWSEARKEAQRLRQGKPYNRPPRKPIIKNGKRYSPFWAEIRKNIYRRDRWVCQECGVHCRKGKTQIQCHHIDFDTSNNNSSNLITLCASCHMKTRYKKEDWKNYYKNILKERGLLISEN